MPSLRKVHQQHEMQTRHAPDNGQATAATDKLPATTATVLLAKLHHEASTQAEQQKHDAWCRQLLRREGNGQSASAVSSVTSSFIQTVSFDTVSPGVFVSCAEADYVSPCLQCPTGAVSFSASHFLCRTTTQASLSNSAMDHIQ
jgi:hypothetical protein